MHKRVKLNVYNVVLFGIGLLEPGYGTMQVAAGRYSALFRRVLNRTGWPENLVHFLYALYHFVKY